MISLILKINIYTNHDDDNDEDNGDDDDDDDNNDIKMFHFLRYL